MATHILVRPDGKNYYLTLTENQARMMADDIKLGAIIEAKGDVFSGKNCKLDKSGSSDVNLGSELQLAAGEIFGKVTTTGFWETILRINQTRKKENATLPWLYADFVDQCRRLSGFSEPYELVNFINAEWDNLPTELNRPNVKNIPYQAETARLRKEFLATDKGQEYARKWGMR